MDSENSSGDIINLISKFKYHELNEMLNLFISTDSKATRFEILDEILDFLESKNENTTQLKEEITKLK